MLARLKQAHDAMEELIRVRNHAAALVARLTETPGEFPEDIREAATDLRIRIWRADDALDPEAER